MGKVISHMFLTLYGFFWKTNQRVRSVYRIIPRIFNRVSLPTLTHDYFCHYSTGHQGYLISKKYLNGQYVIKKRENKSGRWGYKRI